MMKLQARPFDINQKVLAILKEKYPDKWENAAAGKVAPGHMLMWAHARLHNVVWNAIYNPMKEV